MASRFFAIGWRRGQRSPGEPFGRLESEVMNVLWRGDDLPVREVQAQLTRNVAYTTVMTTLDRLFKKGFVTRRREGRAYLYTPACARHELQSTVTTGLLSDLLAGGGSAAATPMLSNLVDVVAEQDDRLLDELERLVKEKRARLRKAQP